MNLHWNRPQWNFTLNTCRSTIWFWHFKFISNFFKLNFQLLSRWHIIWMEILHIHVMNNKVCWVLNLVNIELVQLEVINKTNKHQYILSFFRQYALNKHQQTPLPLPPPHPMPVQNHHNTPQSKLCTKQKLHLFFFSIYINFHSLPI